MIHLNINLQYMCLTSISLSFSFSHHRKCTFLSHVGDMCHAHLILLDFTIFIFSNKNKSQSFSLCNILQPGVTSSFTSQNIFCSILLSSTVQPKFFPQYQKPSVLRKYLNPATFSHDMRAISCYDSVLCNINYT